MFLLHALKSRNVFWLWIGQLTSCLGDQVYHIAFTWLTVTWVGASAGYLITTQMLVVLLVNLFSGKWADRWSPFKTMLWADLFRAAVLVITVIITLWKGPILSVLVVASILIMAVGALFDPAIQAALPILSRDRTTLHSANGLMGTTIRGARVFAPILVSVLTPFLATIHFFTLNAVSFLISAAVIAFLMSRVVPLPNSKSLNSNLHSDTGVLQNLLNSLSVLKTNSTVTRALFLKSIMAGLWWLGYFLGVALLVKGKFSTQIGAFSAAMGAYGIGNLFGALFFGSMERKNHEKQVYWGFLVLGIGFLGVAYAPSLMIMCFFMFVMALGGPINDIPFMDMLQNHYDLQHLSRLFRLRLAGESIAVLIAMPLGSLMFHHFSVERVMFGVGCMISLLAILGFSWTRTKKYYY